MGVAQCINWSNIVFLNYFSPFSLCFSLVVFNAQIRGLKGIEFLAGLNVYILIKYSDQLLGAAPTTHFI